jgi:homoserine kinase type II
MAVYTDLTDDELAQTLAAYDLGEPLALKGIAEGVENSNFLLETARGRFILTIFEKRVQSQDLPFFMAVMEQLASVGTPAPRPMPLRNGGFIGTARGKPCAIVSFLSGLSPRRPTAAQCRSLGAGLAQLHLDLSGFALQRANALSRPAWGELVRPRLGRAEEMRVGLSADLEADLAALDMAWPKDLPKGVIHADLFPDNALFIGDRLAGVIDFYFACNDALAYDLAVCLNAWCFEPDRSYNLTKGMSLIAGYQSIRALQSAERTALPLLARGAAMRFFATRLADWTAVPAGALVRPKDPLEYADKLAFHRRAANPADYGA